MSICDIFIDDNYIVRAYAGSDTGDHIVVSFTGISAPERHDGSFFGAALAIKLGIPWIGIIDRHENWYCKGSLEEAFIAVRAWISARKQNLDPGITPRLVGFGISMGAYAVLKYSRILGLDCVMAAAPQWSLDRAEAPYPSHFKHFYQPFMTGMGVRSNDVHGRIYVFYDPYEEPDLDEVKMFKRHIDVHEITLCYAGHMVLSNIKGSRIFSDMLQHIENPLAFRHIATLARRHNFENIARMIERAFNRNPRLVLQAFHTRRFKKAIKNGSRETVSRIWKIATKIAYMGYIHEAEVFFACATGNYRPCITLPRIMSWRGELLCYCHHRETFSQTNSHLPVQGSMVTVVDNELFATTPVGLVPVPGQLTPIGEQRYAIIIEKSYLSARDDDQATLMPALDAWEEFLLLPARPFSVSE